MEIGGYDSRLILVAEILKIRLPDRSVRIIWRVWSSKSRSGRLEAVDRRDTDRMERFPSSIVELHSPRSCSHVTRAGRVNREAPLRKYARHGLCLGRFRAAPIRIVFSCWNVDAPTLLKYVVRRWGMPVASRRHCSTLFFGLIGRWLARNQV